MRYAVAALVALVGLASANARAGPPAVGDRFEVRIADLPAPYATASARNPPRRIARPPGAVPDVPPGFRVTLFARGLDRPRRLTVAPNGDVLVAESRAGRVTLLRDADGDGVAETTATFARNHDQPHGLAVRGGFLYVADTAGIWRYAYAPGQTHAASRRERVTPSGAFGRPGGHWTRNLVFSRDGRRFFVAVGSRGNLAEEAPPRATVQVFDADGGGQRSFAMGLRNPVGIAFYPGSDDLYVVVNERDGLGDELVPDYLTRIEDGDFFGWPYAYLGDHPQPGFADRRPDLVARSKPPDLPFRAHSAPLGLVFYDADQFPPEYRGDAFVALHGSWNAAEPRGYMVARVPFENGRPAGGYEAFATGFWASGKRRARVWGRPAGLAVAADGSLLIADDAGGAVWRVSYAP
ncbi:MAG: PQQ-dependent sugar dehydrogenase [Alphaproteobacteria bacterium]